MKAETFTHRSFYTQRLLHTDAITHAFTHRSERVAPDASKSQFYCSFCGDRTSFRDAFKIAILFQFLAIEPHFVRKTLRREGGNRNFIAVFGDRTSFRAKGYAGRFANRNFNSDFGDRTSFRAKTCVGPVQNRNFTSAFGDRTSFRAKMLRSDKFKSQSYRSFWRWNIVSCKRVAFRAVSLALPRALREK